MTTTILVPLDFGPEADRALPVGRALADSLGGRLDVVVVTGAAKDADTDEQEAHWHAEHAGVELDGVHLRFDDDVVAGILAQARTGEATLCLAAHAHHPLLAALYTSVSDDVVGHDVRPLVIVGPACDVTAPVGGRMLACLGGHSDAEVLGVTATWARALAAKVEVVTVEEGDGRSDEPAPAVAARLFEEAGVPATWEVLNGSQPAAAVVAAADRMGEGVVVLGSSPGRIHGQALGGVARRVVRRSRRPLLLAPQRRDDPR